MERALIQHQGDNLLIDSPLSKAPIKTAGTAANSISTLSLDEVTRDHIQQALRLTKGKNQRASGCGRDYKDSPQHAQKKMDRLAIVYGKKR